MVLNTEIPLGAKNRSVCIRGSRGDMHNRNDSSRIPGNGC